MSSGSFFDVHVSYDSSFTEVIIVANNLNGGTVVYWWDGSAWAPASDQTYDPVSGSVTIRVNESTLPSLHDLTGAIFGAELTCDGLGNLVQKFVSNHGISNSLQAKLQAAKAAELRGNLKASNGSIKAFINEVQAQSGKAINAANAGTLIVLARALLR